MTKLRQALLSVALCAAIALPGCNTNVRPGATPPQHALTPSDGTYKIQICEGDCRSDPNAISGLLIVDSSGTGFSNQSDAMQGFMAGTARGHVPNYCYFFDPATANSKDTLFEYDIVAFGTTAPGKDGASILTFVLGSPDFRYYSEIETAGSDSFIGGWRSFVGFDGVRTDSFPSVHLHATKISKPDTGICFDAVRKFARRDLEMSCEEFPERTCEPGFKP